ncbi:MAG: DinB family protein [Saprospiraceae bacterium]|nr:DinB family protein [Saprospiraceae bacterium]
MNDFLTQCYTRDLRQLITEIHSFREEDALWKTTGSIRNSSGNLVLHLAGGLNHLIGHLLGQTGYQRDRNREFSEKYVPRTELVQRVEALIPMITQVLQNLDLEAKYPIPFDDDQRTNGYVVTQLLVHLNYHLGQINYLRRTFE